LREKQNTETAPHL